MDAVRIAIQRLGGQVTIDSRPGSGTIVRLTLTFTVLVTRVITVQAGGQVFGIPSDSVVEIVRVSRQRIVPVGASWALVWRDRGVPFLDLAQLLGQGHAAAGGEVSAQQEDATVVGAAVSGQFGAVGVDRTGMQLDVML